MEKFLEDFAVAIAERLLTTVTTLKMSVSCTGQYQQTDNGELTPIVSTNSRYAATINRHTSDIYNKVENQFLAVHDPSEYHQRLEEFLGSTIATLEVYESFTINFLFPEEFQVNALPTTHRLIKCRITSHVNLIYNIDDYCVMHSIFSKIYQGKITARSSLNKNEEYMKAFNEWFARNNLQEFYIDGIFNLDIIEALEERIKMDLNLYTFHDELVELYYRSKYSNGTTPVNLIIIPLKYFYNKRGSPIEDDSVEFPITPYSNDATREFLQYISIKNRIYKAHCSVLDLKFFGRNNRTKSICQYCTGLFNVSEIQNHLQACKNSFVDYNKRDRLKYYKELKDDQREKTFQKYVAKYRVPFCTYDFETRVVDGMHKPFSYSILYFNIFNPAKSKAFLKSNWDSNQLLKDFSEDLISMMEHHWELQNIRHASEEEIEAAGNPPETCPICLKPPTKEMQFNHSHFAGDNLNLHLNRYICKNCNSAMTIRNKPLKFFAHNGSRFDQNLFMEYILNCDSFSGFDFIAKTESRFSEVRFNVKSRAWLKASFNDSNMMIPNTLAKLAEAWVGEPDRETLKSLLAIFYPEKKDKLDQLVDVSFMKQVFPYNALSDQENFTKVTIEHNLFYDNLYNKKLDNKDYKEYLNASRILKETLGDGYTFKDYHDYYLTLVVLLALILNNFSKVCYQTNGIWPCGTFQLQATPSVHYSTTTSTKTIFQILKFQKAKFSSLFRDLSRVVSRKFSTSKFPTSRRKHRW
jgi:hypothetical protein